MWIHKRTAGTQPCWMGLPAVLFILGFLTFSSSWLQAEKEDNPAGVRTAIEIGGAVKIEFFAEAGKMFTVEARVAGGEWSEVYGPVVGQGAIVSHLLSDAAGYAEYRLDVDDEIGDGEAPDALAGRTYTLNHGAFHQSLNFVTGSEGISRSTAGTVRGFGYSFKKISADVLRLQLDYQDGKSEEVLFTFVGNRLGIFDSELSRPGLRSRKASGTFRPGGNIALGNAEAPESLEGASFVLRDRGMTSVLKLTTDFSGTLSRQEGEIEVVSYTYDVSSWPEVDLTVAVPESGESADYTLVFNARNSGIFERRVVQGRASGDVDRGKFSGTDGTDDDDDDGQPTEGDCIAPESLEGRTLLVTVDEVRQTIVLDGAGTGLIIKRRANGRVTLLPFTYTYTKDANARGILSIVLPTVGDDLTQVFELDFDARGFGTCVRTTFEGEEVEAAEDGTFSLSDDESSADSGGDDE